MDEGEFFVRTATKVRREAGLTVLSSTMLLTCWYKAVRLPSAPFSWLSRRQESCS